MKTSTQTVSGAIINKTGEVSRANVSIEETYSTSYRAMFAAPYDLIVSTFGPASSNGDGYKVDVEWIIQTPDGIATIYNYKDGHNYDGEDGLDTDQILAWHVGGKTHEVIPWLEMAFKLKAHLWAM